MMENIVVALNAPKLKNQPALIFRKPVFWDPELDSTIRSFDRDATWWRSRRKLFSSRMSLKKCFVPVLVIFVASVFIQGCNCDEENLDYGKYLIFLSFRLLNRDHFGFILTAGRFKPGTAGCEAQFLPLCHAAPPPPYLSFKFIYSSKVSFANSSWYPTTTYPNKGLMVKA